MAKKDDEVRTDRRGFLKLAGFGTVAGGAAIVAGAPAKAEDAAIDAAGVGYKETDHVKTFYKTARF